jgi:hypothetical protein
LKLKLVVGYMYLNLAGCIISVLVYLFASGQIFMEAGASSSPNDIFIKRVTSIIVIIALGALAAWVVFLIHKRRSQTALAFVIYAITTYGLNSFIGTGDTSQASSLFYTALPVVFVAIDIAIAIFLLQSKETKSQLKIK